MALILRSRWNWLTKLLEDKLLYPLGRTIYPVYTGFMHMIGYYGRDPNAVFEKLRIERILRMSGLNQNLYENLRKLLKIYLSMLEDPWTKSPNTTAVRLALMIGCQFGHLWFLRNLADVFTYIREEIVADHSRILHIALIYGHLDIANWLINAFKLTKANIIANNKLAIAWVIAASDTNTLIWIHKRFGLTKEDVTIDYEFDYPPIYYLIKKNRVYGLLSWDKERRPGLDTQHWLNDNFGLEIKVL